ncbi:MAG: hypothetical protein KBT20_01790 [Bacteroidales bacterium]|nr:hypothetical protein [Candidatus Liminaster caballi]
MKLKTIALALLSGLFLQAQAGNTITTVAQVSTAVTLSDNVDYIVTGSTPFTDGGKVDITNLDHAVLIIRGAKPSKVISTWLKNHVYINGAQASNNVNCQVKMYAEGAIILPYSSSIKPLTVYSEQNFGGTSVNSFGLENDGGYMNTLSDEKLNNQIRSFKLKRGYMVTFSTRAGGRGYSRCFIADTEDLEVATLPNVLDKTITSYRIFKWYDAQKKGVASDTRADYVSLVNASWCYDWGTGHDMNPDIECVPNHIYEDWPSSAACGGVTYSCHLKTNNEPGNSADDHPQDVATVLANWENLMRTGLRLCSESSHDGSMGHLKAFIDSIDARGWRCDVLDLHCYWTAGTFNNLTWYSDHYGNGRPIWISEWVWGASWNNNGAFAVSNRGDFYGNQDNTYNGTKPILDVINANDRVERYAYWNSEADCSKIYRDKELSKLGNYYASMNTPIGYKKSNEFIPRNPPMRNPGNLTASYDKTSHTVLLKWHEYNGEYNRSMTVEQQKPGQSTWQQIKVLTPEEGEADYSIDVEGRDGYKYRIHIVDLANKDRYTNAASAVNENLEPGDDVSLGESSLYLGGNRLLNGGFEFGASEWENGAGQPLVAPYFQIISEGGIDGGAYLQCYGNSTDAKSPYSLRKILSLEPNASYYVAAAGCNNNPDYQRISTTSKESIELNRRVQLPNVSAWARQGSAFTVTTDTLLLIQMRGLGGVAQIDEMSVCRLFDNQADALADALYWARQRAEAFVRWNTMLPWINADVQSVAASATSAIDLEAYITLAVSVLRQQADASRLCAEVASLGNMNVIPADVAQQAIADFADATTVAAVAKAIDNLHALADGCLDYTLDKTSVMSASFDKTDGWRVKTGTYTGGDQRLATQAGKTCWNAWWSISAASGAQSTMAIDQEVKVPLHGLYALECKASTQHFCETDQHAVLTVGNEEYVSPSLSLGVLDIPSFSDQDKWQTLATPYVYLNDGDTVTVGFIGSKAGAVDNQWHKYGDPSHNGDRREGWWCATDFYLRRVPMFLRPSDESGWGTICLPYSITVPADVTLYQIAGIHESHAFVCLEEVTGVTEAGCPYIYHANPSANVAFAESGDAVNVPKTNVNGLRGCLSTTARYPVGSLVLQNGVWTYIPDSDSQFRMLNYSCFIQKLSNMPEIIGQWTGAQLPTSGIEILSIQGISSSADQTSSPSYNAAGQRVDAGARGLIIRDGVKQVIR